MSVKSNVIDMLERNKGQFFSGEELAEQLCVSRAAVWKAIRQLKESGYQIEAVTNRGYRLCMEDDSVSEEGIRSGLHKEYASMMIEHKRVTGSTNQDAKLSALHQQTDLGLFVAEQQTAGKGRRGRTFVTMKGKHIYMSLLLKPHVDASNVIYITTGACVGVHRAILSVTGINTQIKWVNDLYYQGKKVCGILTEAVTDCETGSIDSIVIGIGINFNMEHNEIDDELKDTAEYLYESVSNHISRNQLIAAITNEVLSICMDLNTDDFIEEYRNNSMVLGKEINVITMQGQRKAKVNSISNQGALNITYEDGTTGVLNTGEISIRVDSSK